MKLIDLMNSVWAILPEKLLQIESVIEAHMLGDKLDLKKIEARLFDLGGAKSNTYRVIGESAVIDINGVLSSNPSAFERVFFDAMSMEQIKEQVSAAVRDPLVSQIVLSIDSPGGTMAGTQETANHIYNLRGDKPIIAHSSGMMASAAYYIGAAADKIFLSGGNVMAGSIGTIYRHIDRSKRNESDGVKVTEFVSGKLKNAFTENAPLNQERSEYIQSIVNKSLETFAADLGKFRGLKQEQIGDGKVFLGKEAVDAGIADGFASLNDIVAAGASATQNSSAAVTAQSKETIMDLKQLQTEHPDLFAQAVAEGKAELDAQVKASYDKGLADERARVNGIKAHMIQGHESLANELIANGSSVEVAMAAFIKAENDKRAGVLASINNGAPAPVVAATEPEPEKKADFEQLVAEHMEKNKSTRAAAVSAVVNDNPEAHAAWLEKINGGKK